MKFSILQLLVVGAGLAIQQACAAPIRVVVVTSHQEVSAKPTLRFGHAVVAANEGFSTPSANNAQRRPCMGMRVSNAFRKAFGLPLVGGAAAAPPSRFIGNVVDGAAVILPIDAVHSKGNSRHQHHHHRHSFMRRVHRALMALGPWEGRAVAFVLGCGIGVLLRMMWVMTVITYRMIRGDTEEPHDSLVCELYAEDIIVPPPQYTYEKVERVEEEEKPLMEE